MASQQTKNIFELRLTKYKDYKIHINSKCIDFLRSIAAGLHEIAAEKKKHRPTDFSKKGRCGRCREASTHSHREDAKERLRSNLKDFWGTTAKRLAGWGGGD